MYFSHSDYSATSIRGDHESPAQCKDRDQAERDAQARVHGADGEAGGDDHLVPRERADQRRRRSRHSCVHRRWSVY